MLYGCTRWRAPCHSALMLTRAPRIRSDRPSLARKASSRTGRRGRSYAAVIRPTFYTGCGCALGCQRFGQLDDSGWSRRDSAPDGGHLDGTLGRARREGGDRDRGGGGVDAENGPLRNATPRGRPTNALEEDASRLPTGSDKNRAPAGPHPDCHSTVALHQTVSSRRPPSSAGQPSKPPGRLGGAPIP
jgi:hypothetical protein